MQPKKIFNKKDPVLDLSRVKYVALSYNTISGPKKKKKNGIYII